MLVKQLEIRAFRGIKSLDLIFSAGVNVLIGVNGVGKSSAIECVALLLSEYISELKKNLIKQKTLSFETQQISTININQAGGNIVIGDRVGGDKYFFNSSAKALKLKAEDVHNGMNLASMEIKVNYNKENFSWSQSINQENGNIRLNPIEEELECLVGMMRDELAQKHDFSIPLVLFYPVNRSVLNPSLELLDAPSFTQIEAFSDALTGAQSGFDAFFRWFRALEDLENEERRDHSEYRDHRLEAVRHAIPEFLPEFANLRVRRSPLRMTIFKQGKELVINQLSDGEKCLLAMVGDLARRLAIANPGLSDPLQGAGIILIDEIELHLHPQWQRGVMPKLSTTFPNCQFIVSTHSPQIISDVPSENIYVLRQVGDAIVANHPNISLGRDSNQILEVVMGVSERPDWSSDGLRKMFRLIEEGDLAAANQLKVELEQQMGTNEPDVMKAGAMIRRRELLGK
jgi:predicted ATP-binding protein involved in virulence